MGALTSGAAQAASRRLLFHPLLPAISALVLAAALVAAARYVTVPIVPLWVLLGAVAGYAISGSV